METLRDRVAVVTGGASGIGLAMAQRFAADGAKLLIADLDQAAIDQACQQLRDAGAEAHGVVTDVSDPAAVDALAQATLDRFGGVHVVCNNAGVGTAGALWERPLEELRWVVDVNLWGVIHGIRSFVPILLEQNQPAHVVNVASMAGLTAAPYLDIYTATKHAVVALSEALYKEFVSLGAPVGATVVCPGLIRTSLMQTSERNRPDDKTRDPENPTLSEGGEFMRTILTQGTAGGWDPAVVADAVADAIREDRFYVIPAQDEVKAGMTTRLDDLREGRNPTLQTS